MQPPLTTPILACSFLQAPLEARRRLARIWLSGIAIQTNCMSFSFHITRKQFEDTHITEDTNPISVYKLWNAQIDEVDGILRSVHPLFTLDDGFSAHQVDTILLSLLKTLDSVAAHALGMMRFQDFLLMKVQARGKRLSANSAQPLHLRRRKRPHHFVVYRKLNRSTVASGGRTRGFSH